MYQDNVDKLRDGVAINLRFSSKSYYDIGMTVFHQSRMGGWVDFQPAIGNIAISVELMLKAVVAQKALRMLYSNLPDGGRSEFCVEPVNQIV